MSAASMALIVKLNVLTCTENIQNSFWPKAKLTIVIVPMMNWKLNARHWLLKAKCRVIWASVEI